MQFILWASSLILSYIFFGWKLVLILFLLDLSIMFYFKRIEEKIKKGNRD
jgi:hypothetical protein